MARTSLLLGTLPLAGCVSAPPVVSPPPNGERTPVILVPGMIGTKLVNSDTGRVVWGNARSAFVPRDGGASMALPVDGASQTEPRAVATDVVLGMRLFGLFSYEAYHSVVRLMEANGYRSGDLREPGPDDTFFLFGYDWRRTTPEAAADLMRRLQKLRDVRGDDVLRIHLVCQSTASRICRYLLKYGAATLEEAEQGEDRRPFPLDVEKVVLVGTANGGSLRTLREIHRGRHYAGVVGRRFRPEVVFTYRAVFEGLPLADGDLFVDAGGQPIDVDVFDAAVWLRYQWSVFSPEVEQRLARRRPPWLPDHANLVAYLDRMLDRARRLNRLLAADSESLDSAAYAMIQSDTTPTPARCRLEEDDGRWRTVFGGDKGATGPDWQTTGDGHATIASQNHLSPQERDRLVGPTVMVDGAHFHMILNPEAQRHMVEFLVD
jgi:hypothetical protein